MQCRIPKKPQCQVGSICKAKLITVFNDKHPLRAQIHQVLAALNSVIILLTYLSLPQINLFSPFVKLNNQIAIMALFSSLALILAQLVLGLLYGKQLFLKLQYLAYRNIIFPIAFLSAIGHTPTILPSSIIYIITAVCTFFVLLLQWLIGKQSFARNLLVQRGLPLSIYMLLFHILLSLFTANSTECKRFIVIIMIIFSIYVKSVILSSQLRRSKCLQYTLYKIQTFLAYAQIANILSQQKQSYIFIFALILFVIMAQFAAEYADIMKPLPQTFFNNTDNSSMLILRAQYIIDDLDKLANSQSVEVSNTSIIPIYYEHISKCEKLQCGISHQIQPHVLSNVGHYKVLCGTVFRVVQQLFLNYILTQSDNVDLKLGLIKFYLRGGPNKIKIMQLIAELEKSQLSFEDRIKTYSMKRIMTDIDIVEFIESMKIQDAFHHFNQSVSALMRLLIQFWTQFLDQRVDFQKVLQTAEKITPVLSSIQGQMQQTIKVENFSTIRIMKIYAEYLRWIMNNQMKSAMINDYVQLLNKKMSEVHQINCINADMEMGLVAISLQVKKLGEIKMANSQAANIFNYSKQQFLKTNVNSIMPSVFAKFHDDFLKAFLINEHKKVNTDRRLIIGKKRQGYLFQIYLQLQKSVVTNQQFIFIANIEVAKIHQAPILVVCDDKGLITDFNSTYKQVFDKSWKRSKSHQHTTYTNIQEIIPSFFEIVMSDATETKTTIQCYDNPVFGIIQIKFQITKISFQQCPDAGYSIKGHRLKEPKEEFFSKLSLTQTLMDTVEERDLRGMKVQYLPITNQYQFNQRLDVYGCGQFMSQYTIPYVKLQCFGQILNQNFQAKVVPQYDAEIKTLRFCGDHFERVEQPESFQSEIQEELKTKITDLKLNLIKQSIQNQEDSFSQKLPKIFVVIFAFLGAILLSTFYVFVSEQKTQAFTVIQQFTKAYEFRSQLAQYVLYFQAQSDPLYGTFFTEQKENIKSKLIDQITKVNIPQGQKQRALRIIYLQETLKTSKFQQLINDQTFNLPNISRVSLQNHVFTIFKVLIGIFVASKIILNLTIMKWHRNKLIDILSLFLALPETDIKKSHKKCVQFLKDSNEALNKIEEKISTCQDGADQSDQQQNPHIKIRKFKNISLGKSVINFIKLNIFNVLFFVLFGIMLASDVQKSTHFNSQIILYQYVASVMPQYSTKMMRSYSKKMLGANLHVNQQFVSKYQSIDFYLAQHSFEDLTLKQNFFAQMFHNQCDSFKFDLPNITNCLSIGNGVMTGGVAEAINLLSSRLNSIESEPSSKAVIEQLNQLSILLFQMVKPVILHIHQNQEEQIQQQNSSVHNQILIMFVLFLIIVVVDLIYLTHYPLHDITKNIIHSKVLIQLIPQLKKKTKNGYTQI